MKKNLILQLAARTKNTESEQRFFPGMNEQIFYTGFNCRKAFPQKL